MSSAGLVERIVLRGAPVSRRCEILHRLQVYGLAAVLMFAVLAFGAVESFAIFGIAIGGSVLLVLWAVEQMLRGQFELTISPVIAPVAGFACVALFQYFAQTTAYAYGTRSALVTGATICVLFFVATQVLASRSDTEPVITLLALFGFIVTVVAIVQHLSSPARIYWTFLPPDAGQVFGPYVNRNHFAGCIELLMPLALVVAMQRGEHGAKRLLFGFMAAVMCASVAVSQSRAGVAVIFVEVVLVAVVVAWHDRRKTALFAAGALILVATTASFSLEGTDVGGRFHGLNSTRGQIARDALRMIAQRPLLGWGLGTFESVYPKFETKSSGFAIDHAHNDYLEALVETGVVGFSAVLAFAALFCRRAWRTLSSARSSDSGQVAATIACTGLLLHSFADFNMHIPANAALFMVLAAIATSRMAASPLVSKRGAR